MLEKDIEEFVKKLDFTHGKYDNKDIFRDLISLEVFMIQAYMLFNEDYKKKYQDLLKKYTKEEQKQLQVLSIELAELYIKQTDTNDLLTAVFGKLGLGNKHTGQFFTPTNISDLMAKCVGINTDIIKKDGYITLLEPTSGAGGMILAYARELRAKGFNQSQNLFVVAWDIDILCVYMTYLQLAIYDIPAIVVNGDSLLQKEHFRLYTPQYWIGLWNLKDIKSKADKNTDTIKDND